MADQRRYCEEPYDAGGFCWRRAIEPPYSLSDEVMSSDKCPDVPHRIEWHLAVDCGKNGVLVKPQCCFCRQLFP